MIPAKEHTVCPLSVVHSQIAIAIEADLHCSPISAKFSSIIVESISDLVDD